jgi:hypothetical protein
MTCAPSNTLLSSPGDDDLYSDAAMDYRSHCLSVSEKRHLELSSCGRRNCSGDHHSWWPGSKQPQEDELCAGRMQFVPQVTSQAVGSSSKNSCHHLELYDYAGPTATQEQPGRTGLDLSSLATLTVHQNILAQAHSTVDADGWVGVEVQSGSRDLIAAGQRGGSIAFFECRGHATGDQPELVPCSFKWTGQHLLKGRGEALTSISWQPDSMAVQSNILYAAVGCQLACIHVTTDTLLYQKGMPSPTNVPSDSEGISVCAASPGMNTVAVGGMLGSVALVDTKRGHFVRHMPACGDAKASTPCDASQAGHANTVCAALWLEGDPNLLVTAGWDRTVQVGY